MTPIDQPRRAGHRGRVSALGAGKLRRTVIELKTLGTGANLAEVIRFRAIGTRKWFTLPVEAAFRAAIHREVFIERMAKAAAKPKKAKKKTYRFR